MATAVELLLQARYGAGQAFGQLDRDLQQAVRHTAAASRETADLGGAADKTARAERELAVALDRQAAAAQAAGGQSAFVARSLDDIRRSAATSHAEMLRTSGAADRVAGSGAAAAGGMSALAGGFGAVAGVLAATGLVSIVGNAVTSTLELGGQIADLSSKTRIAAEDLQALAAGADKTGSSVEQLSTAAVQLAKRVTEGNSSTVAALGRLGLTLDDLRTKSPTDQLLLVGDRLQTIGNESDEASVALGLFGRAGADLLPALKGGLKDASDEARNLGLIIRDENVDAIDALGDATDIVFKKMKVDFANALGDATRLAAQLFTIANALQGGQVAAPTTPGSPLALPSAAVAGGFLGGDATLPAGQKGIEAELKRRLDAQREAARISKESATALEREAEAQIKLATAQRRGYEQVERATQAIYPKHLEFLSDERDKLAAGTAELVGRIRAENVLLERISTGRRGPSLATLGPRARGQNAGEGATGFADLPGLGEFFSGGNLGNLIVSAASGGNISRGLGAGLGQAAFGSIGNALGLSASSFLGTLLPGLGGLIGGLAGPLIGKIGGVFTGGEEARLVNPERDRFFAGFGGRGTGEGSGFATVAARLTEATGEAGGGRLFADLVKASTLEDYRKAVDAVTAALRKAEDATKDLAEASQADFDAMATAAEKYGINLDALGPKFNANRINSAAQEIVETFDMLVANGADAGGVLVDLQDEIVALVQEALRTKTPLAESFRPLVEELIRAGKLTDAAGKAIDKIGDLRFDDGPVRSYQEIIRAAEAAKRAAEEANRAIGGAPAYSSPGESGPAVEGGAARGVYANRPGLVLFGEGGEEEVGGPRSFFEGIFRNLGLAREGQAPSGAGSATSGGDHYQITIQALDAGSFVTFLRDGGGAALVQALRDNAGQLRTNVNRALAAQA